jgi:hypothetical protein
VKITVIYGPTRKKPRVGDRRTTKKHGEQIRVFKMVTDMRGNVIGYDCTGGRQRYEWIPVTEAVAKGYGYLLTPAERATDRANAPSGE